jgi:hypothetical protein
MSTQVEAMQVVDRADQPMTYDETAQAIVKAIKEADSNEKAMRFGLALVKGLGEELAKCKPQLKGLRTLEEAVEDVNEAIGRGVIQFRLGVLEAAAKPLRECMAAAEELEGMKEQVQALAAKRGLKTMCIEAALRQVQALDGCDIGTSYADDLVVQDRTYREAFVQGRTALADDPDWPLIQKIHDMAYRAEMLSQGIDPDSPDDEAGQQ